MIDCNVISTGSKGNAVLLDSQVLVDCGVPYRRLVEAGVVDKIKYIFLTHQHKDHLNLSTIRRLLQEHPRIRIIFPDTLKKFCNSHCDSYSFLKYNTSFICLNKWYKVGNFKFSCVPLHHDVPNVGWKLHFQLPQGKIIKVLYATDTTSMDGVVAKNYDLYLVEANYEKDEIIQRIKDKRMRGEYVYEDRVLKTHMSREQCDLFLAENAGNNSNFIYMHIHDDGVQKEEE